MIIGHVDYYTYFQTSSISPVGFLDFTISKSQTSYSRHHSTDTMLARSAISALTSSFGQMSMRTAARAQPIASSSRVQLGSSRSMIPLTRTLPAMRSFSASAPAAATVNQGT